MNAVQRFFRRYIFSTIGIVLLFFAVNLLLIIGIMLLGSASGSDSSFSVEEFSEQLSFRNGSWKIEDSELQLLEENRAWAMLLDGSGTVAWEYDLPETLPRHYTAADVASFSRWYLEGYPVKIWSRSDGGLLVIGFQPQTWVKYYFALEWPYVIVLLGGSMAFFVSNLILVIFLMLRNTRKVEKAMTPILQGIQDLTHGKAQHLDENGELAEISAGLNRAAAYMHQKDNTRAEWIRGVSHDIRTPLSMVLGYASELEDDTALPQEARKQAGIIRRESEKMKRLIDDLNLTTKLEYALQPVHLEETDWAELNRQTVSEVLNNGLNSRYEITFTEMQPGRAIHLMGDAGLLQRMLENLIQNCIAHNPKGCAITLSVEEENGYALCVISDDGVGIAPDRLEALNCGNAIGSSRRGDENTEHGLGLKLVAQIVRAHQGMISFAGSIPHGLTVKVSLPMRPNIS